MRPTQWSPPGLNLKSLFKVWEGSCCTVTVKVIIKAKLFFSVLHMCLWLLWSVIIQVPGDGAVRKFKHWEKMKLFFSCLVVSAEEKGFTVKVIYVV